MKHKITKVTIRWSETGSFGNPRDFDTPEKASAYLSSLGHPPAGYYKTGFEVEWANGQIYRGRIDLDGQYPDIREHVKRVLLFSAGVAKPPSWSEKIYRTVLNRSPECGEEARTILAGCDV